MNNPIRVSLRNLAAISLGILIAACAGGPPKPTVDYKTNYNFSAVKKIAFYDESGHVVGDNPLQLSDIQSERIDEALAYALTNRGFEMVTDTQKADLLLSWNLVTQQKTDVRTWQSPSMGFGGYYGRYNRYSAYNCWACAPTRTEVSVQNYTQGIFIVDLIDPKLGRSVWRSTIQSRLKGNRSEDQGKYNAAAAAIFASFPPPY